MPAASARPLPSAAASAPRAPEAELGSPSEVRLGDRLVFVVRVDLPDKPSSARASAAAEVLARAARSGDTEVHVQPEGEAAVVYVARAPLVQLVEADARAAGDASLSVHADAVAAEVRTALVEAERASRTTRTLIALAAAAVLTLASAWLVRKLGHQQGRLVTWLSERPERVRSLRVRGVEVASGAALRGALEVGGSIAVRLGQAGVLYGWLLVTLSLFPSTRGYSERLTGAVVTPLAAFVGRLGATLPSLVVVALALFTLGGLLRFTRLFFESVARREASLSSLPAELARPVSSLVRGALMFAALLLVAPLISDSEHTPASRLAFVALCALSLAAVPLLASALAGAAVLLSRRFQVGDFVDFGPRARGRVRELRVLDVVIEDDAGRAVHVPQGLALWSPQTVGASSGARIDVAPDDDLHAAREVIEEAARALDVPCQAELVRVDGSAARFRLRLAARGAGSDVVARAVRDLRAAGIRLAGEPPKAPVPRDASPEPTAPSARAE